MSKKKNQSSTMEDHDSLLRYRDGEGKKDFFDKIEYEISLVLLELSHPVVFSSDSPFLHKWGRTKKRSSSVSLNPPKISPEPVIKSLPSTAAGEMGSTSSSSCLTGEAKKTNPQTIKRGLEEEFSTTESQRWKPTITSQPSASSCSVLEAETGLIGAQVGLVGRPIAEKSRRDYQDLLHLQPLIYFNRTANVGDFRTESLLQQTRQDNLEPRGFDLNLPAAEEGNRLAAMVGFQRVAALAKAQAAAQARQRRLDLIRSKKPYTRFISQYQHK